jgi:hypothetical protein
LQFLISLGVEGISTFQRMRASIFIKFQEHHALFVLQFIV